MLGPCPRTAPSVRSALAGCLAAGLAVYAVSWRGAAHPFRLVLNGVILAALLGSVTSLLLLHRCRPSGCARTGSTLAGCCPVRRGRQTAPRALRAVLPGCLAQWGSDLPELVRIGGPETLTLFGGYGSSLLLAVIVARIGTPELGRRASSAIWRRCCGLWSSPARRPCRSWRVSAWVRVTWPASTPCAVPATG